MIVLDVGPGGEPFPLATVLVERFIEDSSHRPAERDRKDFHRLDLQTRGLPVIQADVEALPFLDKSFDFVWCSHVVEHADHPGHAIDELCRVGKAGMIMVPNILSEAYTQERVPELAVVHQWLCLRDSHRFHFLKCDTSDKKEVARSMNGLGLWPSREESIYAESRMVWGESAGVPCTRIKWDVDGELGGEG